MTDKQLAILLTQYHNQLVSIFNQLANDLMDNPDLEYNTSRKRGKWIGKGEEPFLAVFCPDEDWEWEDVQGTPVCLDKLSILMDSLSEDINSLEDDD